MAEPPVSDGGPRRPDEAPPEGALVAHVEQRPDAPDECTIYPSGVDDHVLVTRWVTAAADSFVDLSSMR